MKPVPLWLGDATPPPLGRISLWWCNQAQWKTLGSNSYLRVKYAFLYPEPEEAWTRSETWLAIALRRGRGILDFARSMVKPLSIAPRPLAGW